MNQKTRKYNVRSNHEMLIGTKETLSNTTRTNMAFVKESVTNQH